MKDVKGALKAALCTLAVSGALLAPLPVASAASSSTAADPSWHWTERFNTWVACQGRTITQYGGWNADHVKCEIDGTWSPPQTYSLYLYH
ncbi:hypothetical protein [Streptosporangium sp. 'caverna']|uniref:hypothetical protein n=1 Tax=Streptosporangium sp. 'caverna' TaxID=2202249 RepID=UPI000D7D5F03|nr:hypothetical protein [Streptosporangium sp. 'caverna']AWS43523.1 hypothetical protein DKM19_21220 [Streptosporangium sp. 'caverna']